MKILITFHTTFSVLSLERYAKDLGIEGKICPVPRKYSASCGLCWIGPVETRGSLEELIREKDVEIDALYEIE